MSEFGGMVALITSLGVAKTDGFSDWLSVRVVAEVSTPRMYFVYFPFAIVFLGLLAQIRYFDDWDLSWGLALLFLFLVILCLQAAWQIRRRAEELRRRALNRLRNDIYVLELPRDVAELSSVVQGRAILTDIEEIATGAFLPISRQPVAKAILAPLSLLSAEVMFHVLEMSELFCV